MSYSPCDRSYSGLTTEERGRLEAYRSATRLSDLVRITGAKSDHSAYFSAKADWYELHDRILATIPPQNGLPGDCVSIEGHTFWVHGITHADTQEEHDYLRPHVSRFIDRGATVYCEQGIRPMYFSDFIGVCEMDDYRWAMTECRRLGVDSHLDEFSLAEFEGLTEEITTLAGQFRDATFSLIDSLGSVYGDEFRRALGDVASSFLVSHENRAVGGDFESFVATRRASTDPTKLVDLQDYYTKTFLPQPLEREWLKRHDHELEIVTHARNERMADYVIYHNEEAREIHLIVGAAHQPGVIYYLEQHRDGKKHESDYDPVE